MSAPGVPSVSAEARAWLAGGGVVAAPTETFFGLLADVTRPAAVSRLLALKPRAPSKGMPVLLPSYGAWSGLAEALPPLACELAAAFWPGPLTIALPARAGVDERLVLDRTLAVRLPGASVAAALARALGRPLSATSANLPGEAPARDAAQVRASFSHAMGEHRLLVVDGLAPGGAPSTVVTVEGARARVARVGAISLEALRAVAGDALE
ncbi:MAG: L-threonylcarbamoyladenylate synthase [Sorangiineae bacterium]|nr:L-threonylcarbamoyladenylate synthase [Sorangiineae bacterium]